MKTLHPEAHPALGPRALLLAPLILASPPRAAGLGFVLGLALSLGLVPLAQRIANEPSPVTRGQPLGRARLEPLRPALPVSSPPTPTPRTKPQASGSPGQIPESEIAEELFEGDLPAGELPEADVEAGLAQAAALCKRVGQLGQGAWKPLQVDAIRKLLRAPAIEAESYGELPAIHSELNWIAGLSSPSDLGRRSLEDLRFLAAAIHWYLEGATEPLTGAAEHLDRRAEFDPERLREFVGMDFSDLLAEWD
jgi:hypothetical protein